MTSTVATSAFAVTGRSSCGTGGTPGGRPSAGGHRRGVPEILLMAVCAGGRRCSARPIGCTAVGTVPRVGVTHRAAGLFGGQAAGRVGEHQPLGAGEAEELAQHGELAFCGSSAVGRGRPRRRRRRPAPSCACRVRRQGSGRSRVWWPARTRWCGRCGAVSRPGGPGPGPEASRSRSQSRRPAAARAPEVRPPLTPSAQSGDVGGSFSSATPASAREA